MGREQSNTTVRHAAKVILVDHDDYVLLFRGGDPARPEAGTWWFPPSGGLEDGETAEQGARREAREETGLVLGDLGPIVCHRTAEFSFDGQTIVAEEDYFVTRVDHFEISVEDRT